MSEAGAELPPDALATLHDRLIVLRCAVVRQLTEADAIDGGLLRVLGDISAALAAIDSSASPAEPRGRAVVSDDGEIRLTLYRDDGEAAAVVLSPVRALGLASELIRSAVPKLGPRD